MFNQYSLSVMGIMCEISGSFFLTLEAFGFKWIEKVFDKFIMFSNWTRKSLLRTLLLSPILLFPFIAAAVFKNNIIISLLLPIVFFVFIFTTMIDEARNLRELTIIKIRDKKIGPIGFIMLLIGNALQLISTIIQIK